MQPRVGRAETGVPIFVFTHAGDGNLHPIVLAVDRVRAERAAERTSALARDPQPG